MARGTVNNEPVVSQAATEEYRANCDRMGLGTSKTAKERGRFVWDPKRKALVRPWEVEMDTTSRALDAPVMVGRFYEGVPSPRGDGVVFQTRAQHRAYMREHGLTTVDDYDRKGGAWDKADAARAQRAMTPAQRRDRQERLGKLMYEIEKKPQAQYDREAAERARIRRERGPASPTEE